ncbi:MAG: hypothetical protein Q8Q02_13900 [Nocardioides sp.]|nr:hypothetical protein [Nocardioides sp.]
MTKYRPYSRRMLRRRYTQWVRQNLKVVVLLASGMAGLIALVTLVFTTAFPHTAFMWWTLGVVQVSLAATCLNLLNAAFLAHDREAIGHLRGAWGEENTRTELHRARRKGLIWGWVDSITLRTGDLDHLVVTRKGGLVAVDSKWRHLATDTGEMARAATKARLRAEGLAQSLLKSERRARHRARASSLPVTPVVVLWGAAQHAVPDGARVDDVEFVAGRRFVDWLTDLTGDEIEEHAAADILARLETYRAATWTNAESAAR